MHFSWRPPFITNYAIKAPPPPPSYIHIIIKCHLSSNFLLPSTGLVSMMKKQQQQQQKQWKTERERDGGRCFSSLCPVVDPACAPLCKRVAHRVANVMLSREILLCRFLSLCERILIISRYLKQSILYLT